MRIRELWRKQQGEDNGLVDKKKPNMLVIWCIIAAIIILAVSSLSGRDDVKDKDAKSQSAATQGEASVDENLYVAQLEQRLAETLTKINGAGAVTVFISIDSGGEKILATDDKSKTSQETNSDHTGVSQEETERSVVLSGQGAGSEPYVVKEKPPYPIGVLVVAEGAKDEKVKYELYEAVKALFGLSAHRIKITY